MGDRALAAPFVASASKQAPAPVCGMGACARCTPAD
jgi:hypothetical protein